MIHAALDALARLGRFAGFAAAATAAIPRAVVTRFGEVIRQFERVAWGGLPIAGAAGLSVGLVAWLQTRRLLATYGAEASLPSVLAVAVVVETGPMLASLLVAGRMGAGLAAELASMTLTEEVDALAVLGARPLPALVAPRVVACMLALPLLVVVLDASALAGGLGAEMLGGTMTGLGYVERSLDFLRLGDVVPAIGKTALFGWLVGLIACRTGLHADRSTEAVGRAATRGVVRSMLAVFAANVAFVAAQRAVAAW